MEVWWESETDGHPFHHELSQYADSPTLMTELRDIGADPETLVYRWSYFIDEEP